MKGILVIENELKDYLEIKDNFKDWDIYPKEFSEIKNFELNAITAYVSKIITENNEIVALIIDISLLTQIDHTGLELIRKIRNINEDSYKNKIIPIFCYSRHEHLRKNAYKMGATNFFLKQSLVSPKDSRYTYLRQSLLALAFLYSDAVEHAQRLANFNEINKKLEQSLVDNDLILNALLQVLKFEELERFLSDEKSEESLIKKLGEDTLHELRKVKLSQLEKENLESHLNDVANILGNIPGFGPFAAILRGIKLLSKISGN